MYNGILHAHSGFRYIVLFLLLLAILNSLKGLLGNGKFTKKDNLISLFAMVSAHIQLLLGLILFGISPKVSYASMRDTMQNEVLRFFSVEHILMMLVALVLVTIGRVVGKKEKVEREKHKKLFTFYTIAIIIIFVAIPWPFLKQFGTWF